MHAITTKQDPHLLVKRTYDCMAMYIASGIDPQINFLFCQSHVPQHTELAWILNCHTYIGELNRMTQFKDKAKRHATNINVGLFSYPTLMAADILLYNTNLVPVGEDQKQHIELTRNIAMRFNNIYGDIFTIPEPYITKIGSRIMGLQDPTRKMSKSDTNSNNVIYLLDTPDIILNKLKRAVTDSGKEIIADKEKKPGVTNLLQIMSLLTDKSIQELEQYYVGIGYGKFKNDVADTLINFLSPIQKYFQEIRNDKNFMDNILKHGAIKARERSQKVLKKVYDAIGFLPQI